jgi:Holliday junction DNA helicase RuvA
MLEVNGVGYEIEAPLSVFFDLPEVGEPITLHTHLAVREDAHVLYAFASEGDKALFRSLLKVSGIGAKMALAILSGMGADQFARCVQAEDSASLVRVPGIGKKTAERLIVEMRDRLDALDLSDVAVASGAAQGAPPVAPRTPSPASEAADALVALGYKPQDATRMVKAVEAQGASSEELIRAALRNAM